MAAFSTLWDVEMHWYHDLVLSEGVSCFSFALPHEHNFAIEATPVSEVINLKLCSETWAMLVRQRLGVFCFVYAQFYIKETYMVVNLL